MAAGLVGYLSYETIRLVEKLPNDKPDALGLPDGTFIRPRIMIVFDSVRDELTAVTPVFPDKAIPAATAYSRAQERLAAIVARLEAPLAHGVYEPVTHPAIETAKSNTSEDEFYAMVARAKEYILAGDIFSGRAQPTLPRRRSSCLRSRSTGRCGGSIPRRSSSI